MADHPITPPIELMYEWVKEVCPEYGKGVHLIEEHVATQAAQWGADQELQACCEWVGDGRRENLSQVIALRAARRPKPKSQAEEALEALDMHFPCTVERDTIRAALERLRELEGGNG